VGIVSVLSIFKNPMILLGLVSMALFFGMPKLVENSKCPVRLISSFGCETDKDTVDPEMRAEWEERQKENPMNSIMGAASGQNANPMGNFDMAAFLAGSGSNKAENKADEGSAKGKSDGKKKR
jgi:O-acetylhomoserine/O-acetylserine sulfhydrylase